MRKFKRSTNIIVTVILFLIFIYYVVKFNYLIETYGYASLADIAKILFFLAALGIAGVVLPPDFKYLIKSEDDYIIFEMDEDDHRRINKNFCMVSKGRHYLVLDDGFSRIKIAYNKDVLNFLMNEIN